ncbi:MAG: type II toxin-antitoxin system RelE/ParE family toxin [Nitrospira sp.]|nr:type II toxin-antitoxin system RelE/ParE family toxin [Nitrospira sp.]
MTALYSVVIKHSAEKDPRAVPLSDLKRVIDRIRGLAQQPRLSGYEKLSGESERYRIRQGDYRIVYGIADAALRVDVVKVGHRREVYR